MTGPPSRADDKEALPYGGEPAEPVDRFEQAREVLRDWSLPQTDNAALMDYVDYLEENGYRGWMQLEPEEKVADVVFEVALEVGYQLGVEDGADAERCDRCGGKLMAQPETPGGRICRRCDT